MAQDYIIRAMTTNKEIRAVAVRSTHTVNDAQKAHQTTAVATAALGRALTGGLIVGNLVKSGMEISLDITGDGPLKRIIVNANYKGEVRGYVSNPKIDFMKNEAGKLDVAKAIGKGYLTIKKDLGIGAPYTGSVPLISGEIAEDLTYYFTQSEQTPSAVGLGVLVDTDLSVKAAGGFMIQLLPDAREETIAKLEENLAKVKSVTALIDKGLTPEEILEELLTGFEFRVLEQADVKFQCKCNREQIAALAASLGEDDLRDIIAEQGKVEVRCHFCNELYQFSEEDIEQILSKIKEDN